MIRIENTGVFGWGAAIRGMRNPMNSWDKSDSHPFIFQEDGYYVGENDLKLMKSLSKAGDDHGKFLRYLVVYVDITAPLYWWKEFKTYRKDRKFMDDGDEILDPDAFEMHIETNSCSTMHKIHAKEFTIDDFSHEHLSKGEGGYYYEGSYWVLNNLVTCLNKYREEYLKTKDKKCWYQMIQLLPNSYNQKRTVKLNYQVLKNMYHAHKNHKLDEWHAYCDWIESLPYFKEMCLEDKEDGE